MTPEEKLIHKRLRRLLAQSSPCTFTSYVSMCTVLKLPIKEGNSKKAQIKLLQTLCDLQKSPTSRSYTFSTVYAEPDQRILQDHPLALSVSEILLHSFLGQHTKSPELILDTIHLWKLLGFVNQDYAKIQMEEQFITFANLSKSQFNNFKFRCKSRLNSLLESSLNVLSKRNLISYESTKIIFKPDPNKELIAYLATPEEQQRIHSYEQQALADFKCSSIADIWAKGYESGYYHHFKNLIKKNEIANGWVFVSNGYKIVCTDKSWLNSKGKKQIDVPEETLKVNYYIINALQRNAEVVFNNYIEKIPDSSDLDDDLKTKGQKILGTNNKKEQIMSNNYLFNQQILTDRFIRITQ